MQHTVLILLLLLISHSGICLAGNLTLTGSWAETIDASDLVAGAGSDLIGTYESAANQVIISIDTVVNKWEVYVKKIDSNWHANFQLSVRRTSSGTGSGSISLGTSYQQVTDIDELFFKGRRDRANINVQLQLTGVSVQIPPDTYTTTVYYTVTEV